MTIWLNGELLEHGAIAANSAGVTLGWGVFTTMGVRDGKPLFLQRHIERLRRDALLADIAFTIAPEALTAGVYDLLQANTITEGLLRLTLTRCDDGRWSIEQGADLSIQALPAAFPASPLRVQLSPYQVEARRPLAGVKTTSYLSYLWAWREAKRNGFDEAILQDGQNHLSEGARSTLFWTTNGEVFTPSLDTGCLRGLGRDLVLEWAQGRGITVHQGYYPLAEALEAEQVYLVTAASGPRSVSSWHDEEGNSLKQWQPCSGLFDDLRTRWGDEVAL